MLTTGTTMMTTAVLTTAMLTTAMLTTALLTTGIKQCSPAFFFTVVPDWDDRCRNADAGVSFTDANAHLWFPYYWLAGYTGTGTVRVGLKRKAFFCFTKMRKSCKNGQISAKFRIKIFAKIYAKVLYIFCENFVYFLQKFLQKQKTPIFAKFFAKMSVNFSKTFAKTKMSC
jgi:hypothetical protein